MYKLFCNKCGKEIEQKEENNETKEEIKSEN